MPFRYVEIIGKHVTIEPKNVRQLALFYPFDDQASDFSCSDTRLNRVWELCKYTLKATPFMSLYCDGNRERMPYEADAFIQQLGHYAVDREFSVARYTHQFLIFNPSWPTEWHMHTVFMALADYRYTGNCESIRRFYPDLKAKTLLALARDDGLISTRDGTVTPAFLKTIHYSGQSFRDIVDWPAGTKPGDKFRSNHGPTPEGERDGYVFCHVNTVVNAFHAQSLKLMAELAAAIGKTDDAAFFTGRAARVTARINELLLDKQRGVYVDGDCTEHASLHANMFPLAFGLVPESYLPSVLAFVKSRGMACSVYGAQYLLDGLYNAGEAQYALDLMTSSSKRSWLNMIRVGASMTTEAWDEYYKPNLTWNHAWGSAPANIIPRRLMGVEPLEPGFGKMRIKPQPAHLARARLKLPTIRGIVVCDWERTTDGFLFSLRIPANTSAEVWLPAAKQSQVTESGISVFHHPDVRVIKREGDWMICQVPAGQFQFAGQSRICK